MSFEDPASPFSPTRWTLVLRARGETGEARAALSELCEAYYHPVVSFLRCEGQGEDAAREVAQEFFARILGNGGLGEADPRRGRFRSYLLGALKHFLADRRKYERRLKRGGGTIAESLDALGSDDENPSLQIQDTSMPSPEAVFDREWALAIVARGIQAVEKDCSGGNRSDQFEVLKPWLTGDAPSLSQADAARRLGVSEGSVKVAIHRLRKRFREAVRSEISQTLRDPTLVDEELRHLIDALA